MGCDTFTDGNGKVLGIACSRGRRHPKRMAPCVVCHKRRGVVLCDGELEPGDLRLAGQETCDAPLCKECRVVGGPDTDYCPRHKDKAQQLSLFG